MNGTLAATAKRVPVFGVSKPTDFSMLSGTNSHGGAATASDGDTADYRVNIGWKHLTYSEGEPGSAEAIKIYIDPPARYGQAFTFYVPGEARWREVMPAWSVERRAEIVARIKDECSHYHAEWVEG